jgi:hypothetical protein
VEKGPAAHASVLPQPEGLLCNPCGEDEEEDDQFPFFHEMKHRWNEMGRKTEVFGDKPVPVPLYPSQISHGVTRDRNRTSAVGGRR